MGKTQGILRRSRSCGVLRPVFNQIMSWRSGWNPRPTYAAHDVENRIRLRVIQSRLCGGGDKGEFGESSTHPKPSRESIILECSGEDNIAASGGALVQGEGDNKVKIDSRGWRQVGHQEG
jgi:hypothetical protein